MSTPLLALAGALVLATAPAVRPVGNPICDPTIEDCFGEFGDAPSGVLAYPPDGVIGSFPTCVGTPNFVFHAQGGTVYLGSGVDYESDGNHNDCGFLMYDEDECDPSTGDAGLTVPAAYTINTTGNYVLCGPPTQSTLGNSCDHVVWGPGFNIIAVNTLLVPVYLQILADWNHNGMWDTQTATCPNGDVVTEQPVVNFPIPSGHSGPISGLGPPAFPLGASGYVWIRVTISSQTVPAQWSGGGQFVDGETEDYLLRVDPASTDVGSAAIGSAFELEHVEPNPSSDRTGVVFSMREGGWVRIRVVDLAGRAVATMLDANLGPGLHTVTWNGLASDGRRVGPGVYFVRAEHRGTVRSQKLIREY